MVAGIIVAQNPAPEARVGYLIPVRTLAHYLPALAGLRRWRLRHDSEALRTHWDPEARGLPGGVARRGVAAGWHFSGRIRALATLIEHLNAEDSATPLRTVTGEPGSGKSAVLARLVTLSDADYRHAVPAWVLAEAEQQVLPPVGGIDLAVHMRARTAIKLARRIVAAAALAVPVPAAEPSDEEPLRELGRQLGQHLSERPSPRPFTLVVDALDEARNPEQASMNEPRRVALLLSALAATAGPRALRCLVGTRGRSPALVDAMAGDLLRTLGTDISDPETTVDLGRDPYLDAPALQRYIKRLLSGEQEDKRPPSAAVADRELANLATAVADAAAGNFLIALLTALAVREAPDREIVYPKTVGQAFDVYLGNFGARRPRVEALFRALAYAEGTGLAARDPAWALIAGAVGDAVASATDEQELARVADEIERFVQADGAYLVQAAARKIRRRGRIDHVPIYRLYHQAIVDHLRADRLPERQRRIVAALYDAVPGKDAPEWERADPYTLRYLIRHTLASDDTREVDLLLTQPPFCVHADPAGFEPRVVLCAHSPDAIAAAHVIGRSINWLRRCLEPCERAAQLGLSARQAGYVQLAARLDAELERCQRSDPAEGAQDRVRWHCRWAVARPDSPHFALIGHTYLVSAVAVARLGNDQVIVSGGGDGMVRVWNGDGSPRGEPLTGHTGLVHAVAVATLEGEQVIVSGGEDGTVRAWNADGSPRGEPLTGHIGPVHAVAEGTLADEQVIVSGSGDGTVRVWNADGSPRGEPLTGHRGPVHAVAVGSLGDAHVIVSGGRDRTVRVWNADGSPRGEPLTGHTGPVLAAAVGTLGDDQVIVSGGSDRTVRVWNADGSPRGEPLVGHNGWVSAVAVGALGDDQVIVSGGDDRTVRVWNADGSPRGEPLTGHTEWVDAVAVGTLADEQAIVSSGHDGTVRVWNAEGSPRGEPLTGHTYWVHTVAVGTLGDEQVIVSGGEDRTVRVRRGDGSLRGEPLTGHTGPVYAVAVGTLADEPAIVSGVGGFVGTVKVWNADGSCARRAAYRPHRPGVCGRGGDVGGRAGHRVRRRRRDCAGVESRRKCAQRAANRPHRAGVCGGGRDGGGRGCDRLRWSRRDGAGLERRRQPAR